MGTIEFRSDGRQWHLRVQEVRRKKRKGEVEREKGEIKKKSLVPSKNERLKEQKKWISKGENKH